MRGHGQHVEAHLLAHMSGERVSCKSENAHPQIGDERRIGGQQLSGERRRVLEIEHRDAAGEERDQEPGGVLCDSLLYLVRVPRRFVELDAIPPVALNATLDKQEQIRPHRLRASVAAPHAPEQRVGQKQGQRRQDEQAGEIVDLLRPKLDEEKIEAGMRHIDEDRLARLVGSAIPANEGEDVINAKRHAQDDPFDAPISPPDSLRVDLLRRRIERAVVINLREI